MRTQQHSEQQSYPQLPHPGRAMEVDGKTWFETSGGRAMTYVERGGRRPPNYHYSRRNGGGRVFYLFLGAVACLIMCPASWVLLKAAMVYA